jgi:CRP-like cAMP-binding protein
MASPLLDALKEDQRRQVLAAMSRRRYKKSDTLFHEGDPGSVLHLIDKGKVAIRVSTPLGEVATLTVLGPGEVFGEQALLTPDSIRTASAVALEPTETLTLNRSDFDALRANNPRVEALLVQVLAAQVRRLSDHLVEALYVSADKRVLRRLVTLAELYRDSHAAIEVGVTQEELATMAGTTRPTVNQVLRAMEQAGVVSLGRGRVTVNDLAALAKRSR